MSEFDLIRRYFTKLGGNEFVRLGVGDDAAITTIPDGFELLTTVDTLVADVHFFAATAPELVGYKCLAVNLSDLAAMAARPSWYTLSITLPKVDETWLAGFSRGMFELARQYNLALVGGDTVRGPLSMTVQACGVVEQGKALRRSGAKPGDKIYVTGCLGDARLALEFLKKETDITEPYRKLVCDKLHRPTARIAHGLLLCGVASAAIDISDGMVADLSHILECSDVGAELALDDIPLSEAMRASGSALKGQHRALYGGDDYELCFTVPLDKEEAMLAQMKAHGLAVFCIGKIVTEKGVRGRSANGQLADLKISGYDHFT